MAERTCTIDGCERKHQARGLCHPHYNQSYRNATGKTHHKMYERTCVTCGTRWQSPREEARFCKAKCKGVFLAERNRKSCPLPADHPVMMLIAEVKARASQARAEAARLRANERRRERDRSTMEWRTARQCPGCACWFSPLCTSTMLMCSKRCTRRVMRRRRRAREVAALGSWTWSEFMRIAKKFNYCCAYCGAKPERLDPDHVVPLSRGGYDSPSNLLPVCNPCNGMKSAMTLSEWAEYRAVRGQEPRATNWAPEDKRYWHLTQTMLGISPAA